MMLAGIRALAVGLGLLIAVQAASANEWTRFRGPNGSGVSADAKIPTKWTLKDFAWRVALPGVGHSSPVVWDGQIFLTSADPKTGDRVVLCRSARDGSEVWTHRIKSATHHLHRQNSFASATPAIDARHVYVLVTTPGKNRLIALTHKGKPAWEAELGSYLAMHGPGTSPMVYNDMVIVPDEQQGERLRFGATPGTSSIVALDAATGKVRWKTARKSTKAAYSTPCVFRGADGRDQLILTSNAHGMTSLDPRTGKVNWEVGGVFDKRTVSSPVVAGNLIFGTSGSGGGGNRLVAIDASKAKGVEKYVFARSAPYVPTPVAKGGLLFLCNDKGVASCIDLASGEVHWQKRIGGYYSASPVIAGDRVYLCDYDNAQMLVIAASKEFKQLATNPLGEPSRATPAIVGDTMFIRTESHLMAIGK